MKTLIALPVYNEEKTLFQVLQDIKNHADFPILILNDGSTDQSLKILKNFSEIKVINHKKRQGYGRCVIDIFKYALKNKYDYLIKLDADFQHEAKFIPKFLKYIPYYNLVSGSRYHPKSKIINPAPQERQKINQKITKIINQITHFNLSDSFCGFKVYQCGSLKKLTLTETGYGFPMQFWIQAYYNNFKIKELPINLIYIKEREDFKGRLKDPIFRLNYYLKIIKKEMI
ncbi:MAG: glycosyltransferase family 2 protein [Armatimonadetes bacterium]|nr:glycosyltransferase family 2 protein [Armatimonadota bacterium]